MTSEWLLGWKVAPVKGEGEEVEGEREEEGEGEEVKEGDRERQ